MPVDLRESVPEEGTCVITTEFEDEDSNPVIPTAITWTLTDDEGNVVNSRENIAVGVPAASIDILLYADDVQIGVFGTVRRLLVQATYDSVLGSNLPLKGECYFTIENLTKVT